MSLPTISEHPNDMNINVLNSVSFKCTAQGFGVLKIVWKRVKHNMPLTAKVTEEKTLNTITSILKFTTTIGYYSGQYYCVAEGEAGEVASQTANLHIQGNSKCIIIMLLRLMVAAKQEYYWTVYYLRILKLSNHTTYLAV